MGKSKLEKCFNFFGCCLQTSTGDALLIWASYFAPLVGTIDWSLSINLKFTALIQRFCLSYFLSLINLT